MRSIMDTLWEHPNTLGLQLNTDIIRKKQCLSHIEGGKRICIQEDRLQVRKLALSFEDGYMCLQSAWRLPMRDRD